MTGRVIVDGMKTGELAWSDGESIVNDADLSKEMIGISNFSTQDGKSPYGCNMAFRAESIEGLKFDERLALYGWLEDRDFGARTTGGGTILTDFVWGVHLGTQRGRTSDTKFGYSQVVNPWYLMKKGTMNPFDACLNIARGLFANLLKMGSRRPVSRRDRLRGNLIGIKDIALGHWAPEKVTEL